MLPARTGVLLKRANMISRPIIASVDELLKLSSRVPLPLACLPVCIVNRPMQIVKQENPGIAFGEIGKIIGEKWKKMSGVHQLSMHPDFQQMVDSTNQAGFETHVRSCCIRLSIAVFTLLLFLSFPSAHPDVFALWMIKLGCS